MTKKTGAKPNAPTSREKLKSFVDRIVRLREEIASLKRDEKDIVNEAKNDGFDPNALKAIVKETMQTQVQRAAAREVEAIVDLYRASLGMLDGTPLGDAARRRYERELDEVDEAARSEDESDARGDDGDEAPEKPQEPTPEEAREQGRADHAAGKRIIDNPFPTGSSNRAAWDEGWCTADGSDGMDLPRAWRRNNQVPNENPESA